MASNTKSAKPKKNVVGVSNYGREEYSNRAVKNSRDEVDGNKIDVNLIVDNDVVEEKNYQKMSKSKKSLKSKKKNKIFRPFYLWSWTSIYQIETNVCQGSDPLPFWFGMSYLD